jgi:NAD(P)-dependent dehydrogenase (short-subunit alcohol dehydrogenase family)
MRRSIVITGASKGIGRAADEALAAAAWGSSASRERADKFSEEYEYNCQT